MTVTSVISGNNVNVAAGDQAKSSDYFIGLNAQGHVTSGPAVSASISTTQKSWELKITKPTGMAAGTMYLEVSVDYFYVSTNTWQEFWSNSPAGWTVDPNFTDSGAQINFDYAIAPIGAFDNNGALIGERPTKVRLHVKRSVGFTTANVLYETSDTLTDLQPPA